MIFSRPILYYLRQVGLTLVLAAGLTAIVFKYDMTSYALRDWLVWRYLSYIAVVCTWNAACFALGAWVVARFPRLKVTPPERLLFSITFGVFGFFCLMFIAGVFKSWSPFFAVSVLPALLTLGGREAFLVIRRVYKQSLRTKYTPRKSILVYAKLMGGAVALAMIYLTVLTPHNASFDGLWYHLGIAEEYAVSGGLRVFPEGRYHDAYPHLSTYLYAWCLLLPKTLLFDRLLLCAHLEYSLFLWTLAFIPSLVRRLGARRQSALSWVVTFTFPAIFLYDSSLSIGADHVAAFWAAPIFIALLLVLRRPSIAHWVFFIVPLSGAISTKYTAFALVFGPLVFSLMCFLAQSLVRKWRPRLTLSRRISAMLIAAVVGLVATSPFWLKNWIWYGDPFFPILHKHLTPHMWTVDAAQHYETEIVTSIRGFRGPDADHWTRWFRTWLDFSLAQYDWHNFHRDVPIFGFLFSFSTLALPFLRKTKRVWLLTLFVYAGLMVWFWMSPQLRYLQALLPWMVAVTAVVLGRLWQDGLGPRVVTCAAVAFQLTSGSDTYFIPSHAMNGTTPIKLSADLITSGFRGQHTNRYNVHDERVVLGKHLPPTARVLFHEEPIAFGIDRQIVVDSPGYQGAISYGRLKPWEVVDMLRKRMRATHAVWVDRRSRMLDSVAGDLSFFSFTVHDTEQVRSLGPFKLAKIKQQTVMRKTSDLVTFLGCDEGYTPGLYLRSKMTVPGAGPRHTYQYPKPQKRISIENTNEVQSAINQSDFIVLGHCHAFRNSLSYDGFSVVAKRAKDRLLVRLQK